MYSRLLYDLDDMKQKMLDMFTLIVRFRRYVTENA